MSQAAQVIFQLTYKAMGKCSNGTECKAKDSRAAAVAVAVLVIYRIYVKLLQSFRCITINWNLFCVYLAIYEQNWWPNLKYIPDPGHSPRLCVERNLRLN